jgi:hypothetical protein
LFWRHPVRSTTCYNGCKYDRCKYCRFHLV